MVNLINAKMENKTVFARLPSVGNTTTGTTTASNGLDSSSSEDSSYDSDYCCEASEDSSVHCDVSRTTSDTLAQEFSEYINIKNDSQTQQLIDSNYLSKVEFARKLGYSEDQVKIALGKLGQFAKQNELLAELIQLDVGSNTGAVGGLTPPVIMLQPAEQPSKLRHIVIDGSNVAMSHGSNKVFSSNGIKIAVDYFRARGHKEITVFVPMYRKENNPDDPVTEPKILTDLESEGILVWTPSKKIKNRRMICYDDRYVVKLASETDGIVVSNDNYRDLTLESADFKRVVEQRTLMYSFVNDRFMPPEDPLGRHGPTLDQFLMCNTTPRTVKQIPCPYGRKCTYGTKCKYYHMTHRVSVTEVLRKQAASKTTSLPILRTPDNNALKMSCTRTKSAVFNSPSSLQLPQSSSSHHDHHSLSSSTSLFSALPPSSAKSLLTNSFSSPMSSSSSSCSSQSNNNNNNNNAPVVNGHRKLQRVPSVNPSMFTSSSQSSSLFSSTQTSKQQHLPKETKSQMFYNLAAIFPEDRVRHVMSLYPLENDPQVICRLILEHYK